MTADLPVPDASFSALFAWHEDRTLVSTETTIQRIAEPMIALFLRDLADSFEGREQALTVPMLRYIADELLPPEVDAADGQPV